jgi:hypothetical protein
MNVGFCDATTVYNAWQRFMMLLGFMPVLVSTSICVVLILLLSMPVGAKLQIGVVLHSGISTDFLKLTMIVAQY